MLHGPPRGQSFRWQWRSGSQGKFPAQHPQMRREGVPFLVCNAFVDLCCVCEAVDRDQRTVRLLDCISVAATATRSWHKWEGIILLRENDVIFRKVPFKAVIAYDGTQACTMTIVSARRLDVAIDGWIAALCPGEQHPTITKLQHVGVMVTRTSKRNVAR